MTGERPRLTERGIVMKKRTTPRSLAGGALLLVTGLLAAGMLVACGGPTPAASSPTVTPSATANASPQAAAEEFRGMLPYVSTSSLIKDRPYASTKTVGDVEQMRHAVWTWCHPSAGQLRSRRLDRHGRAIVSQLRSAASDMSGDHGGGRAGCGQLLDSAVRTFG